MKETFTIVPNSLLSDKGLNPLEKLVLIMLLRYRSPKGLFLSQKLLAEEIGVSKVTILRTLRSLQEKGYLVIEHRRGKSNLYHINLPETGIKNIPPEPEDQLTSDTTPNGGSINLIPHQLTSDTTPVSKVNPTNTNYNYYVQILNGDQPLNVEEWLNSLSDWLRPVVRRILAKGSS